MTRYKPTIALALCGVVLAIADPCLNSGHAWLPFGLIGLALWLAWPDTF